MWVRKKHSQDATLDLTPLVDMVFLLNIFFMVSTTFIFMPAIRIDLPQALAEKVEVEHARVSISVDAAGALYFDQDQVDERAMRQRLAQAASANSRTLVLVRGDRSAGYGPIVDLLDMVRQAGLHRIAIVTGRKKTVEALPVEDIR